VHLFYGLAHATLAPIICKLLIGIVFAIEFVKKAPRVPRGHESGAVPTLMATRMSAAGATLTRMAFKVNRNGAEPALEFDDNDKFEVLTGGVLKISCHDQRNLYINPTMWASIEETPPATAGPRVHPWPEVLETGLKTRWYACPDGEKFQLRVAPRLASWNKADDPDQVRLRAYLDDTESLLATSRVDGPWTLRLDVGLPAARNLLDAADLDNYAYPLASQVRNPGLVSVWCTKQHSEQSFVRIEAAREISPPSTEVLFVKTTASASTLAYKQQIHAAVAGAAELPPGPVRLELAFVVGPGRNWLNLWKQTIDSLDPILGRTYPDRPWHPLDGRITELGMHLSVDRAARHAVVVSIAAAGA
jgi:hypothetical protein